jgi:serine/threonine-protein kinase HipA
VARLLDDVIFNVIVGNNDAHGKNFSLLYRHGSPGEPDIRLSPLYDVVSTVYYPELSSTWQCGSASSIHPTKSC